MDAIKIKRLFSGLLAVLVLLSAMTFSASAGGFKQEKNRAIAIVYDNSGSMYGNDDRKAWCRATYAMEVFASMMNEGDVLYIYPMNLIEVDGSEYTYNNPLVLKGGDDTSEIEEIYTLEAAGTPIETLTAAYNGIRGVSADETWLVVLTDGDYFHQDGESLSASESEKQISALLNEYSQDMNVMYLGIGSNPVLPNFTSSTAYQQYSAKAGSSTDILSKLTAMCNMIFGRDELSVSGKAMSFDVSMSKLIVFVQGDGVSDIDILDAGGASIGAPDRVYAPQYSTLGCVTKYENSMVTNVESFQVDETLSGVIATYSDVDAGSYTLSYSGSGTSVGVYYEPDVDLMVYLTDANGNDVSTASEVSPGDYYLNYGLVDSDGNLTKSALLGDTAYDVTYTINGEDFTVSSAESGSIPITVSGGDTLGVDLSATYLSGYTIHKTNADLGWPSGGLSIAGWPVGVLSVQLSGGESSYSLSQVEQQGVYYAELSYDGQKLSGQELENAQVSVSLTGGNLNYELTRDGDRFVVELKHAGAALDTDCGDYQLAVTATYINEYGESVTSDAALADFTVEEESHGLAVQVKASQGYYQISRLDSGDPVVITITKDGQPLAAGELAQVQLDIDTEGLEYTLAPSGDSAYELHLVKTDTLEAGRYKITATASMQDELGEEISDSDSASVKLGRYPAWLPWVIVLIILVALAALVWTFLNMKVLPRHIKPETASSKFTAGGMVYGGQFKVSPGKQGGKRGRVTISAPSNPAASCQVVLQLEAISPRRTASKDRRARVVGVSVSPMDETTQLTVDATRYVVKNGRLVSSDGSEPDLASGANIRLTTRYLDLRGRNSIAIMSATINFS